MTAASALAAPGIALVCGAVVLAASASPTQKPDRDEGALTDVVANDNRTPAGSWRGDTLVLRLVAQESDWYIHEKGDGAFRVAAFAEEGKPASIPGPLLRVSAGTPVHVIVRNAIADTLFVRGLAERAKVRGDSIVVLPGATAERRFVADREGTFFYWAGASSTPLPPRNGPVAAGRTSQLTGAFVVDPAGTAPISGDRIFMITEFSDTPGDTAVRDARGLFLRDYVALNGKSWPHTERLTYAVGDTVRWRVINGATAPHSMHLHGFYFRVVSLTNNMSEDSIFPASQPRMAVTEQLPLGRTLVMEWMPERAGGWIFHCHMTPHIARHPPIDKKDAFAFPTDHPHGDDDQHLSTGMNGLLLATRVTGAAPAAPSTAVRRLRLFVQSDSSAGDVTRRFGYVLQRDGREPARDSLESTSPILVLQRNQPTSIEVINRSGESTAVHWHGMELESYFDGVVGFGGTPDRLTAAIRAGSSFSAHMTPPRAGTFMYHTHFMELRQQYGGLSGALIVLEPGERWDAERDRVFLIADTITGKPTLNGRTAPAPMRMRVGTTYRLRIANIAVDRPVMRVYLMQDSVNYATWRPIAKDGWSLSGASATPRPSWQRIGTGETADFEFTPQTPGDYVLELRPGSAITGVPDRARPLLLSQVLRAR